MTRVELRPTEIRRLRGAMALGLHNFGLAVQNASMSHTPVAGDPAQGGDFATFNPDQPIGGTLRRSHYTATFLDGQPIAGPAGGVTFEAEGRKPDDVTPGDGIVTIVGTSAGYGLYVHEGTSRMASRPFLTRGLMEEQGEAPALIAAGAKQGLGQ